MKPTLGKIADAVEHLEIKVAKLQEDASLLKTLVSVGAGASVTAFVTVVIEMIVRHLS